MSHEVQDENLNKKESANTDAFEAEQMDRTYSRTMTEVETDEIREVRERLKKEADNIQDVKLSALVGEKP